MAGINVRLRVVGVFYDRFLTLTGDGPQTVRDVLDTAVRDGRGSFVYTAETRFSNGGVRNSLKAFEHVLAEPLQPTLGDRQRPAGRYVLGETVQTINGSSVVHAWQYYVLDKDGKVVSNAVNGQGRYSVSATRPNGPLVPNDPMPKAGFTPFDVQTVEDGAEVVWRNVAIVRSPATPF